MARGRKKAEAADGESSRAWWIAVLLVFVVAAILRVTVLDIKPLHHDEGVNGFFLRRLAEEGTFHYDPANYHGPTLPYAALVSVTLFGSLGTATVSGDVFVAAFNAGRPAGDPPLRSSLLDFAPIP